jgi:hypothetical protein
MSLPFEEEVVVWLSFACALRFKDFDVMNQSRKKIAM